MKNEELKPCPFCGGSDVTVEDISTEDEEYYMVQCNNCCAAVCFGDISEKKENAIAAWNRRTDQ